MKTICFLLASFVLVLLCKETSTLGLFQSLDFARGALMKFSKGKKRTVLVKSPIDKKVVLKKTTSTNIKTSRQKFTFTSRARRRLLRPISGRFRPRPRPWSGRRYGYRRIRPTITTSQQTFISTSRTRRRLLRPISGRFRPRPRPWSGRRYGYRRIRPTITTSQQTFISTSRTRHHLLRPTSGKLRPRPRPWSGRRYGYRRIRPSGYGHKIRKKIVKKRKPLPVPYKPRITYKNKTKVYKARSSPSNHFLMAINEIERAVAEARVSRGRQRFSQAIIDKLKKYIKLGSQHRSYHFARRGIGQALHLLQSSGLKKRRGKRFPPNTETTFLADLRTQLSPEKFDELLAVQGDVTLMFAIDTTGSMREEILNAKKIAIEVVNYDRPNPVDFILSPFNDPEVGPTTFHEKGEELPFITAIQSLTAKGGGDCPEKTFQGILNALLESPRWGSPLYVFTDATAKDDTPLNIDEVDFLLKEYGITANFFTTGTCSNKGHDRFYDLAEKHGGQVIRLNKRGELKQLSGLTGSVLGGSNTISVGSNLSGRKKRSLSKNEHSILIDDSIEDVTFSITTEKNSSLFDVTLKDPRKVVITSGKVALSRIQVYQIKNPKAGTWKLTIPTRAGKSEFFVKGSSATNIDFEHSFMIRRTRARGRITEEIPIWHPVIGQSTQVLITVAGANKVRRGSLTLKFITKYGEFISSHLLGLRGKNNVHYISTFTAPSKPFRIQLDGTTTSGYPFKRISRNIVTPKGALLRVVHASNYFTLPTGQTTFVMFEIISGQQYSETFDVKARSKRGYMTRLRRSTVTVRAGHQTLFSIRLRSTRSSDVGKTEFLTVSVTGKRSRAKSVQVVQLMVVDS